MAADAGTVSAEYLKRAAETLGQLYWVARSSGSAAEFFQIENPMWTEVSALHDGQLAPASTALAKPKVEQQRWVVSGVYDRSILGIPQLGVFVEEWGTDVTLQAISGEQRHRLLKRYREDRDLFGFLDELLFYSARDPVDPQHPFFRDLAMVAEMRSTTSRELCKIALCLSGIVEGGDVELERGGLDASDLSFLLRAVRLAPADAEMAEVREAILREFLWRKKEYWENAPGPSLYGLVGQSVKREWLAWLRPANRERERSYSQGKLEYLANRERSGARSARLPDSFDQERDAANRLDDEKFDSIRRIRWTRADNFDPEESSEESTEIGSAPNPETDEESAALSRALRSLWLYKRPSSLDGAISRSGSSPRLKFGGRSIGCMRNRTQTGRRHRSGRCA